MMTSKKNRAFSIVSAILFLFSAVALLIGSIDDGYYNEKVLSQNFIKGVIILSLSILFFIGKKNVSIPIAFSIYFLNDFIPMAQNGLRLNPLPVSDLLCIASVIFISALSLSKKNINILKKTWFIPIITSALLFLSFLQLINPYYNSIVDIMLPVFSYLLLALPQVFVALFYKPEKRQPEATQEYIQQQTYAYYPQSYGNQANNTFIRTANLDHVTDKLREYKQLLDDGVITQEDFDKIKNSIMNS